MKGHIHTKSIDRSHSVSEIAVANAAKAKNETVLTLSLITSMKHSVDGIIGSQSLLETRNRMLMNAEAVYANNPAVLAQIHTFLENPENVKKAAKIERKISNSYHKGLGATAHGRLGSSGPTNKGSKSSNKYNRDLLAWFNLEFHKFLSGSLDPAALAAFFNKLLTIFGGSHGNSPAVQEIAKELGMGGSTSGKFSTMMLQFMLLSFFMKDGGAGAMADMAKLQQELDAMAAKFPGNSFLSQLANKINAMMEKDPRTGQSDVQMWLEKYSKMGPEELQTSEFQFMVEMFVGNSGMNKIGHNIFMYSLDKLIKEFQANPALLIAIFFGTMGLSMNEQIQKMGSEGDINKQLAELNKYLSEIEQDFANAQTEKGLSGDQLKNMMKNIGDLLQRVDSLAKLFGVTITGGTNSAFSKLLNISVEYNGKQVTLKQLMGMKNVDWNQVAGYIGKKHIFWKPKDPKGSVPVPAGPTSLTKEIISSMQTTGQTYNSQQQTISTEMSKVSQQVQTLESLIQTITTTYYSQGWIGQLVKNQVVT